MFRGREMAHTELGAKLLDRLASELGEISQVEAAPKQDGRNMTMVLSPVKRIVKPAPKEPHPGAAKRLKRTGTGTFVRAQAGVRHFLEHKSGERKRRLQREAVLSPGD